MVEKAPLDDPEQVKMLSQGKQASKCPRSLINQAGRQIVRALSHLQESSQLTTRVPKESLLASAHIRLIGGSYE